MKVIYFLLVILLSINPLKAEEIHQSPKVFEECSSKTNILIDFQNILKKYKLNGESYKDEYKTYLSKLDFLEEEVRKFEQEVKKDPSNTEYWKNYNASYKIYKNAVKKINELEENADQLHIDSELMMTKFITLRNDISIKCDGVWQIGIIRKYCKNSDDQFIQFCKQFDK